MKKIFATLVLTMTAGFVFSQAQNPVSWTYEAKKKTADSYEIILTATVEHPWHIYSQHTGKGGPIATEIRFKPNPLVIVQKGTAKEIGKLEKTMDSNFGPKPIAVSYYSNKVVFVQSVKLKGNIKTNVSGIVEYMVCDDSRCLPPVKKSFDLKLQ
ncbi:MAG: hypothetical protein M0Q26_06225 [Chitinophagaceae bacterium]|nr:hypothetical protein [Chitinophagaceae bacterium]MDP1762590.1 protein-disulfide reductase DsbD family protein [Sediminibacterium sp.]